MHPPLASCENSLRALNPREVPALDLQGLAAIHKQPCKTPLKLKKVALLSDSSTQWLAAALKSTGKLFGFEIEIVGTSLYQISSEIYNPNSVLYTSRPDYIIVYESSQNLLQRFRETPLLQRGGFCESTLAETRQQIEVLRKQGDSRIFLCDVEEVADGVFGLFSSKVSQSADFQIKQYSSALWKLSSEIDNLYVVPTSQLHARYGSRNVFDARFHCLTGAAVSLEYTSHLAKMMMQMLASLEGTLSKCLILDLDNTLWGGVVGDVGPENVEIGELGLGRAYRDLQAWALELKNRGVILAVSSKNDLNNAQAPFLQRSEMLLKLSDFACFEANWNSKDQSISKIREVLNIGWDSLVFVDDNPMERDLVRQFLPDVVVPELPADPASYVDYLVGLDLFSVPQSTAEDSARTEMYQAERIRVELQSSFSTFDDYLASLEMAAQFRPVDRMSLKRTAQLFQKSNQFNLRTIRYSEDEVERLLADPHHRVYSCSLRDRFGDYGLISAVVLKIAGDHVFIDNWVMSCRVFNRGLETFMLARLVELSQALGKRSLVGEYLPTPKNGVVADLYSRLGFTQEQEHWVWDAPGSGLASCPIAYETKEMVVN